MHRARLLVGLLCGLGIAGGIRPAYNVARADVPPPPGCPEVSAKGQVVRPTTPRVPIPADALITIRAEEASGTPGEKAEFVGRVQLERDGQSLSADYMDYDERDTTARARGSVVLQETGTAQFATSELELNSRSREGHSAAATYRVDRIGARGDAQRIEFAGPDLTKLFDVRYTTCPPGEDDWYLRMGELKLDTADDIGTAYHTTLEIEGLPVFYWPYLNFPISQGRKSGFLMPAAGLSDKRGFELDIPYYFNIAPNLDDTLTSRLLTKRGLQVQNEFRYLFPGTTGKLDLEYLPNDRVANDDRAAGRWLQQSRLSSRWSASIDVSAVSDKQYLDDFGNNIGVTAQTVLPQVAALTYGGPDWRFQAQAMNFQTIDPTLTSSQYPYKRLPQLILAYQDHAAPNQLHPQLYSEANYFLVDDARVTGTRLEIIPGLALPLANAYAFLTPKVGARYLGYHLDNAEDDNPAIALGYATLDSGLFFDRSTQWFGTRIKQTLEPRLFYVYVPYKNQDSLPIFDTSTPTFAFGNLFQENRFVGGDRIGDANQLTTALTARVLSGTDGHEYMHISVGRIAYLDERRVNLPPGTVDVRRSDYAGEIFGGIGQGWYAQADIQWNADDRKTERSGVYLQYHPDKYRIINVGNRYIRNDLRQFDISGTWPVFNRWGLFGRSLYSFFDDRNVETNAGIQYRSCCWGARIYWSRRYSPSDAQQVSSILFEIQLIGLGHTGRRPEDPLEQGLTRYETPPPTRNLFDP